MNVPPAGVSMLANSRTTAATKTQVEAKSEDGIADGLVGGAIWGVLGGTNLSTVLAGAVVGAAICGGIDLLMKDNDPNEWSSLDSYLKF